MSNKPKKATLSEPENPVKGLISPKAHKLIIDFEVGGGKPYYNKFLAKPTWPGGDSGITIGVGYDIGYNDLSPWKGHISEEYMSRLSAALGKKGKNAKALVHKFHDIRIPWEAALHVFETIVVPHQVKKAKDTFPGMEELHPDVQGVLVSLVFNRGTSMTGSSRREMREVKKYVAEKNIRGIADSIVKMKRLWVGKGLDGLLARREAEAELVLKTIVA